MPCGGSLVNLIDDCRRVMGNLGWTSVVIHRRNFSLTFSVDVICKISNNDNREVKHQVYVKQKTRICTTWPSFSSATVHYFSGFSIRNGVDGRIWEVGGEILKDAEGVFSERRKAQASRGVRGHAPPENFENLGLLECISRILGHE